MPLKTRHVKKLITALNSGNYTQIRGKMHDSKGFDILGLSCEVYRISSGKGRWVKNSSSPEGEMTFGKAKPGLETLLPQYVVDWYGFDDQCPSIMYKSKETLFIDLNDAYKLTFKKIADVLEKSL